MSCPLPAVANGEKEPVWMTQGTPETFQSFSCRAKSFKFSCIQMLLLFLCPVLIISLLTAPQPVQFSQPAHYEVSGPIFVLLLNQFDFKIPEVLY